MPKISVSFVFEPRPGTHVRTATIVMLQGLRHQPSRRRFRASPFVYALVVAALVIGLLAGCSRPPPPRPDMPALAKSLAKTHRQLDQIEDALWLVEAEVCNRHAGGRCL